jgi:hypothetical protein
VGSTRFAATVALTILGVLAVLGCLAMVASAIVAWTSTPVCFSGGKPGVPADCVRTGPAADLSHAPWTYVGFAIGLFAVGAFLFTLRERIRTAS